jgi:hypothetical protein
VTDQGVRHITHLRVRSQWRKESEVPLKRPVEPSAEEIIPGREAGQPHDARGIAKRIYHNHQTGAEIAERHKASSQQPPSWHATLPSGGRGRRHRWVPAPKDTRATARAGLVALYLRGGRIVPPLYPRAGVVPNLRIPEEPEGPVGH